MAKFKLRPDPVFKRKVGLTRHDGKVEQVEFEFKHRDRRAVHALKDELKGLSDVEVIKLVAIGWELEDAFTDENLRVLVDNYLASGEEVFAEYMRALHGARQGN